MPEMMPLERLLPCLLDRLTDGNPHQRQESRDRRVISPRRYLEAARRDLRWLLNSSARTEDEPIQDYPEAVTSVLNYGIPDLVGMTAGGLDVVEIERRLRQAILAFEPRLVAHSLSVRVVADPGEMSHNAISFEIAGELWAQPAPESFYVKTEVDLETGQWEI